MLIRTGVFLPIEIRWVWMPTIWMIGGEDEKEERNMAGTEAHTSAFSCNPSLLSTTVADLHAARQGDPSDPTPSWFTPTRYVCVIGVARGRKSTHGRARRANFRLSESGFRGEIAMAFGDLLKTLWAPGVTVLPPRTFKSKLAHFAPQFSGFNQHDSQGKWVYDESYPLYSAFTFPFIDEGFNCEANGILDKDYMKWRWKPQDCYIPRFNATNMLDITKEKGNYCFIFVDYKCTVDQILIN
ncbi:unnamed protein product [Lactuca saligna]|uniref:Trichome birefringence-like N-terminal domain-containing protein n=1 Tax=Lactuca saligna TaxID=75948 RepID=A0AA35YN90_LACSI|nr:unnamed protein product [Lactuca saligna]